MLFVKLYEKGYYLGIISNNSIRNVEYILEREDIKKYIFFRTDTQRFNSLMTILSLFFLEKWYNYYYYPIIILK